MLEIQQNEEEKRYKHYVEDAINLAKKRLYLLVGVGYGNVVTM